MEITSSLLLQMGSRISTFSNTILRVNPKPIALTIDPQSLSGNRLIRRADFHVGHFLTKIVRTRNVLPGQSENDPATSFLGLTTSKEGSLGFISAINERVYRRLNILQGQLVNNEEQPCALNPRGYRYIRCG
jgi:cleavage and polyadenylation specificity factor subunit 1